MNLSMAGINDPNDNSFRRLIKNIPVGNRIQSTFDYINEDEE